jgi:RNA-directed DNA polymerase
MKPLEPEATRLALALLSGPFDEAELLRLGRPIIQGKIKWLDRIVNRIVARFGADRPRRHDLVQFLLNDKGFRKAADAEDFRIDVGGETPQFVSGAILSPSTSLVRWNTTADLRDWLGVDESHFDWLADRKHLQQHANAERLQHYRYAWIRKRHGRCRLIESPKQRLKEIQQTLLRDVFEHIPVHNSAHGFRKGRSVTTHALPHVGKAVVLRMDLLDFFPSISPARLSRILMLTGYAEEVANVIAVLCTNTTPAFAWKSFPHTEDRQQRLSTERLFRRPHFPQGAPTSPAIANICAYRLDCRLAGLAKWANAEYTRYADDLVFSGNDNFRRVVDRFRLFVSVIAMEEGFNVNHRKTSVMTKSNRQMVTGLVLNEKLNVPRQEFDRLKATLHQCVLKSPESQNHQSHPDFRSHLLGRIQYVGQNNESRTDKLMRLFNRIVWT